MAAGVQSLRPRGRPAAIAGAAVCSLFVGVVIATTSEPTTQRPVDRDAGTFADAGSAGRVERRPRADTEPTMHTVAADGLGAESHTRVARNSDLGAGLVHLVGGRVPTGATMVRFRDAASPSRVGVAYHRPGLLDLWLRAPAPMGSTVTIVVDALADDGSLIAPVGTVSFTTGDRLLGLPHGSGAGRRIVVDLVAQQMWLVDAEERIVATFLVSGRRIRTSSGFELAGVFRVYSRSERMWWREDDRSGTARFMTRWQRTASHVGSHGLPESSGVALQTEDDLGWPLSSGCPRLRDADARAVFEWARRGTVVVVLDTSTTYSA